ncbi:MAG: hypothetical protein V4675_22285 [Verrucomicrobiota bacterium]
MIEGWHNEDYFILFDEQLEAMRITQRYMLDRRLPGYTIIGLCSWDDFIVRDSDGTIFTLPTVPARPTHLRQTAFDIDLTAIQPDPKIRGQVKWYIQPLIFGGDPTSSQNITWISLDQHVDAVNWWNNKYDEGSNQ